MRDRQLWLNRLLKNQASATRVNRSAQMRGHRERSDSQFSYVSIVEWIPASNLLRIRLTKPLLEAAGLAEEIEIEAAQGVLSIRPSTHPRASWAEAASFIEP